MHIGLMQQKLTKPKDGMEGGAKLMAHVVEKPGFCPVGCFCLLFGPSQFSSPFIDTLFQLFIGFLQLLSEARELPARVLALN